MSYKYKICIVLFFEILSDQGLLFRFQIERVTDLTVVFLCYQLFCLIKTNSRDLVYLRKSDVQDLQLLCILFFQKLHGILQESGLHCHDIFKAVDVSHLKVQRSVLIQMSLGVVFLCTEYRCRLEYTIKYSYHHLFVELRRLLQHCRTMEILQFEQVCSTLGTLCTDLWSMDLSKAFLIQEITEASYNTFLNLEFCTLFDISQRYRTHVELCIQRSVQFPFCNRKRHGCTRSGEDLDASDPYFNSTWSTLLFIKNALYFYSTSLFQIFQIKSGLSFLIYALQKSVSLTKYNECHITHITDGMNSSVYLDCLTDQLFVLKLCKLEQVCRLNTCHKFHVSFPPESVVRVRV